MYTKTHRRQNILWLLASFVLLPTFVHTQTDSVDILPSPNEGITRKLLGLGISLDPSRIGQSFAVYNSYDGPQIIPLRDVPPVLFYLPIHVTNKFRLEPSLGWYSTKNSNATTASGGQSTGYTNKSSIELSAFSIGVRGSYLCSVSNAFTLYFGPRFDVNFLSSKNEYSTSYISGSSTGDVYESSETDLTFGFVCGGEYFPTTQFSVGGEISLNYMTFGNPDTHSEHTPSPQPPVTVYITEQTRHSIRTDAIFFVRWYFLSIKN